MLNISGFCFLLPPKFIKYLLTKNGWKLSPAYDINPTEKAALS